MCPVPAAVRLKMHPAAVQDMLKFGNSSREYILLHDKSQGGTDA